MTPIDDLDEWRAFGFWFEYREEARVWFFRVTMAGSQRLVDLLESYARDPRHVGLSEHEHFGPYCDLKITTWPEPRIDSEGIMAPVSKLEQLGRLVRERITRARAGDVIRIGDDFMPEADHAIEIQLVRDEDDMYR